MPKAEIDNLAQIIWDYHLVRHTLRKADCIFVLTSNDVRVAEYAADLYLDRWAPMMIFAGSGAGHNQKKDLLTTPWEKSESEVFANIAMKRGVPREKILIENKSTNTGENVAFVKQMLAERHLDFQSFILVQKPYMERRTFATFKKIWPEKEFIVTSPPITFQNYPNDEIPKDKVINIMVGDLQRIKEYPAKGFQIPQEIPDAVWAAYEKLVALGFTKHLYKSYS